MSDQTIYAQSITDQFVIPPFVKREIARTYDMNSGAYSTGQIQFDFQTVASNGKWASWREATWYLPVWLSQTVNAKMESPNPYMLGWKSSWTTLIDSFNISINGTQIITQSTYINAWIYFNLITSVSRDYLAKFQDSLNMFIDTPDSFLQSNAASTSGNGFINNLVTSNAFFPVIGASGNTFVAAPFNAGFQQRLQNCGYNARNSLSTAFPYTNTSAASMAQNTWINSAPTTNTSTRTQAIAEIPLALMADIFDKLPLCKNLRITMTVFLNVATCTLTTVGGSANVFGLVSSTNAGGRMCPFLFSSGAANQPNNSYPGATSNSIVLANGFGTAPSSELAITQAFTQSFVEVPCYVFEPSIAENYIEAGTQKLVSFKDVQVYYYTSISSGTSFTQLVTNGIINPIEVLTIPFYSATSGFTAGNSPQYSSPFDTAPCTSAPYGAIQNYQVTVGGLPMFTVQQQYDWQQFNDELSATLGSLNGGQTIQLSSGLISKRAFETAYRYYYANISRRLTSEDATPKSVQISGTNLSGIAFDLLVFVSFKRQIRLDVTTGQIVS